MRIKILLSLALSSALVLASGCVITPLGTETSGMFGFKDTLISKYEKPVPMVTTATREVLKHKGKLLLDNIANNTFEAKVNERKVFVKVEALDPKVTQVTIMVRGPFGADIDLAAELKADIALQLMAAQNQ